MAKRPQSAGARPKPLSIRFSDSEKATLRTKAGGVPLGTYIRQVALDGHGEPRRVTRSPIRDGEALGQLLGLLGQSRIANNLNQLAKAANLGALPVLKETEDDIRIACAAVLEMRTLLLRALGVQIFAEVRTAPEVSEAFGTAAAGADQ